MSPIPALYRGFPLQPDDDKDPYVFRIDASQFDIGTARIIFSRDPRQGTMRIHLDVMPLTLEKQPAYKNPRLWLRGALGALAVTAAVGMARRRRKATA